MSPSDELAYLKSLVGQLTDKIAELEAKATSKKPTPAQQLRTILVGPPGAGTSPSFVFGRSGSADDATGRQGHAGAANTRRVLCMSPRDGRHVTRAGSEEDGARCRGEKDHGCGRARLG